MGKHPRATRVCIVCQKTFTNEARYPARFCSRECAWKRRGLPIEQRFWSKVDMTGDCWIWQATGNRLGYGHFWAWGEQRMAPWVAWFLTHGRAPSKGSGICVLHRCDNPPCVRPDHLFLGDAADNMADKMAKGRHRAGMLGKRSHRARFSDDEVRAIRREYANGATYYAISKRYSVHDSTIRQILSGITYRYVT